MSGAVTALPMAKLMHAISAVAPRLPGATVGTWADALAPAMRSSGISTERRIAAFLGQVTVESGGFLTLEENLSYSAERLCAVWPSRFPSSSAAASCERDPEALANAVYCNRMGNGDAATGDGWTFRGRGLIQLTGRANYEAFATACGKPLADVVNWCATPTGAAMSACWFWSTHKPSLNALADGWQLTAISHAINGGNNGIAQRIAYCNSALNALTA